MAASTWSTTDLLNIALSGGNLTATVTTTGPTAFVRGKDPKRAGKNYFEITCVTYAAASTTTGIMTGFASAASAQTAVVNKGGAVTVNGASVGGMSIGALTGGNVVGIAVDFDAKLIWFRVAPSGNWNGNATYNPATSVGGASFSVLGAGPSNYFPMFSSIVQNEAETANFGGSAFTGAVPAGFTSGWDDSVSAVTYAVATQVAAEHWLTTSPPAQITQVALEHWATVTGTGLQAVATQIALEHWATVASRSPGGPMITMIG